MNFSRVSLYLLVGVVVVGAGVGVADALVVTDQERLEAFLDVLTRDSDGDRIGRALGYADPNREPVDVVGGRGVQRFGESEEVELESALRAALAPFASSRVDAIQRAIQLSGENARVALRVRTDEGLTDAQFDLRRHGDGWLVRRVAIR